MTKKNCLSKASHDRNRWLAGGSALAVAAASLTLVPGQAYAQSRVQAAAMAPAEVSARPISRQLPQAPAPRETRVAADGQTSPVTTIASRSYAGSAGISLSAPIIAVTSPTISAFSSTIAPSNGDTNTAGINVAASANYFASQVNFTPGAASDVVDVLASSAIINWTTNTAGTAGGQVTFLGAGSQLDFTSNLTDYTVLNRIFTPTIDAAVRIDGTINSSAISGSPGGNIWFYSPGGLIIGSSSVFNVGSLVLTSSNLDATGPTMNFTGVADANTAVIIEPGAQISALAQNSYFAIVAPRVEQGGSVDVNGSVAYVAAEQAQLTINNGLFDISVGVGSADANGVVHTGTTTGAAAAPAFDELSGQITDADARGIYMVAVPKNTAITMLVGGTVGYQPASAASLADNGSIILSAGTGTIIGGTLDSPTADIDLANVAAGGNVLVNAATFTSDAGIYASDNVTLAAAGSSVLSSGSDGRGAFDLSVVSGGGILLSLQDSATINFDGDLTMKSAGPVDINLTSTAGMLSVGGDFVIDTSARGADDFFTVLNNGGTGIGADAIAGSINLTSGGGTNLNIGGDLVLDASAQGGKGEAQNGSAAAGDISANFTSTGSTTIGGFVVLDAQAIAAQNGKIGGNGPGLVGSSSAGGNVSLTLSGAGLSAAGLFIDASATASSGQDSTIAQSNDATAGAITVNITSGNNQFGDVFLISQANSADSFDDAGASTVGLATRGSVGLNVTNFDTFLGVSGNANIDVSTYGVVAPPSGNTVSIIVNNVGTSGGMFVDGNLGIDTVSSGGSEVSLTESGSVLMEVADGQLFAGGISIDAFASANGGSGFLGGGTGQNFQGGDVILRANANGRIDGGFGSIDSTAVGAINTAGDASGGSITLEANDGAIAFQSGVELRAGARGGAGSDPLDGSAAIARGGDVILSVSGPSGALDLGDILANTDASIVFDVEAGSVEFSGQGGSAGAGDVVFNLDGGSLTANFLDISSKGSGGSGGSLPPIFAGFSTGLPSAGDGGLGQGGIVTFNLNGSVVTINDLVISADGIGGSGADGDFESGTSGGRGGDAIGGAAVFNALAGTLTTNNLIISAQGNTPNGGGAGGNGSGSEGGDGGNATGGSATFNLIGTAMISAGAVLVTTDGYGGRGGSSSAAVDAMSNILPGQAAGDGGDGTGGTSIFSHTSGDISFADLTVSAAGVGGGGGGSSGFSVGDSTGAGGAGGDGTGGIATINLNQDDGSDPTYFVIAEAVGGAGGGGLFSGDGGAALGGTANLTINNSAIVLVAATVSGSAAGGNAGFADTAGGTAGSGGNALGGTANLNLNGAPASISSSEPIRILADAFGGNGADGPVAASGANGGEGGAGGSAAGGSAQIVLTGAGASLIVESQLALLSANGLGGQGGTGGISFDGLGGTGGLGGDATGGSVTLQANSGTTLTLDEISGPFTLTVTGTGGAGGQGGDGGFSTGSAPGIGGNGGTGVGGSPTLRAIGGTISGTNVALAGIGFGGNGGAGGLSQTVAQGAAGNGGNGIGGSPTLELFNGSPGIISLGDLTVTANGIAGTGTITGIDAGGLVIMRDLSTEAGGVFSFGSLTVDATGFAEAPGGGGLIFIGGSGTNTVAGNMNVDVTGDITYAFDGNSQITVGGNSTLFATGNILVTHINNSGAAVSIDTAGNVTAIATGDITADTGSIIGAGGEMFILAGGNIAADDLRALPVIRLSAGGNVLLNNALASGPQGMSNVGGIFIDAGRGTSPVGAAIYDPNFNVTITGSVQSYSDILVNAGGSAIFTPTANVAADNSLVVRTGDDIIVQAGAMLSSANNPSSAVDPAAPFITGPNLSLLAGSITNLTGPILSPISSIVTAGGLNSNSGAVILNANAIGGLGGTIAGSSLSAEINDAPGVGLPQSDDAGLLGASCVEGNVCLGSVFADNRIEVGQNSNNDVIRLVIEQGTISANDVLITIRDAIVMGSNGIPTIINAANTIAIESLTGDVNLVGAAINSNQITIAAAGSLLGNGSLTSANDIGITVAQDVNALLISAGGQLTSVAGVGGLAEAQYSVPGSINVITYTQGGATPLRVVADGNNSFGTINMVGAQNITLIGGNAGAGTGDVFLGAATGAGTIALTGDNVGIGNLLAGGAITANAISGAISFGSATAGTNLTMTASGAITGGNLAAGGSLSLNASIIAIGNASANTIQFISGTDILFDTLTSPNVISLSALSGVIGANTGAGDINSDDNVDLTAQQIDLGNVTSGGTVTANATAGDAAFGTIDAANDITVIASGTPSLTNAISGGNTSITGSIVALANGTVGGDLSLTATAGNINGNGTVSVGGAIALAATGDIGFGTLAAQGGDFTADAGGAIAFTNASSSGALDFVAGGPITAAGTITAGEIALDSGGAVAANSVNSTAAAGTGINIIGTTGITVGSLTGNGALLQATAGAIQVTNDIDLSGVLAAEGRSVFLRSANALTVRAIASAGGIDILAAGNLDLRGVSGSGDIVLASANGSVAANAATPTGITSSGGAVSVSAANNFSVNSAVSAANALTINVGGVLDLQASATGSTINALVGDLNIGTAGSLGRSDLTSSIVMSTPGNIVLGGAGGSGPAAGVLRIDNSEFARIFSGGDLTLNAQSGPLGGGNITVETLNVQVGSGAGTPRDGAIGPAGGLFLQADAAINVIGAAALTNAGANSVFSLAAATIIQLDPATGALMVRNANGGLAGQLDLIAPRIEAISDRARLDIVGASTAAINNRLGTNDGAINNVGYFSAANLSFAADNALLIQNSGGTAFGDRRGFTANNVTIDASGSAAVIVINGTVGGLTGFDALSAVGVPGLFDPRSTINGCLILNVASCAGSPNNPSNPVTRNPVRDLIDEEIDPRGNDNTRIGTDQSDDLGGILAEMRKPNTSQDDPLLDDPVTGAGNEDLWVSGPDCESVDADSEACAVNGETEPAE